MSELTIPAAYRAKYAAQPSVAAKRAEAHRLALRTKAIADAAIAEGRDATPEEWAEINANTAQVEALAAHIKGALHDEYLLDTLKGAGSLGGPEPVRGDVPHRVGFGHRKAAQTVAHRSAEHGGRGLKSLLAVGSSASLPLDVLNGTIVETGRPASSLFDVLPAIKAEDGVFSFLQQGSRENRAATVARGAQKPVSTATLKRVTDELTVVAHIMEDLYSYDLDDIPALTAFVSDEMGWGLEQAVAAQVIGGDGTKPNLRGILQTSGVRTQAMVANATITVRKALGQLEASGYEANAVLMHPSDWEGIETATLTSGAFMLSQGTTGAPLDAVERRLWGVRVALVPQVPVGKAIVLGKDAAMLFHDGRVKLDFDTSSGFKTNTLAARCEGRFGFAVSRPDAIVLATLA